MKVAILTDSFPPYISGVSTYCVSLAKELIKKGHKVLIMAPKDENNVIPHGLEKAKIVRLPSFSSPPSITTLRFCLPNTSLVTRKIKAFKADIIEIEGPTFLGIDGLLASKILNIPCVSTFHTFTTSKEYLQLIFKIKSRNLERISWAYHRWFYNSGNFVFATTPKMLKIMAKNGIKKSKMSPITLLFDFERVNFLNEQEKATLKKFYGLKKNVAVFLGRISKEKNLDTLIKIWAGVIKKNPNSTLLIIGGGPYEKRIKKLIAKLKIGSNVVLTGVIENERLLKSGLLSICDVFVSASISETFGLTGIEAMASNLPVILFKSQGVSEIVDNAGFVIKHGLKAS